MKNSSEADRRAFLMSAAGTGLAALSGVAAAQSFELLDEPATPTRRCRSSTRHSPAIASTAAPSSRSRAAWRWAQGPVYFPEGGYLLVSVSNNRIMK